MREKLLGYSLLSFFSFCLFIFIFRTVALAEGKDSPPVTPTPINEPMISPTPTIFFLQNTGASNTIAETLPTATEMPTPTLFSPPPTGTQSVPTQSPTSIPTPTPTVVKTLVTTPVIVVSPTPTAVPTPTLAPTVLPSQSVLPTVSSSTDLDTLFSTYADIYHVDKGELQKIARCESGFNSQAANGIYLGMFQFAPGSWVSVRSAMGLDTNPDLRTNAGEAIRSAAYMLAHGQASAWPNCH